MKKKKNWNKKLKWIYVENIAKFDSFIYLSFNAKLCLYIIKIRGKKTHTHTHTQ